MDFDTLKNYCLSKKGTSMDFPFFNDITPEAWETGTNIPQGSSQRLLEIVNRDMSILQQYVKQ